MINKIIISRYCNNCKQARQCSSCTLLTLGPEILILILERGKDNELDIKINFNEHLNLFNYIQMNNTGFNYKLFGVVSYFTESLMNGYFIAYCVDPISHEWYKFNYSIVTKVENFQNEVIYSTISYLLFY